MVDGGTVSALKEGRDGGQRAFGLVLNRRRQRRTRVVRRSRSEVGRLVVRLAVVCRRREGGRAVRARLDNGIRPGVGDEVGEIHGCMLYVYMDMCSG